MTAIQEESVNTTLAVRLAGDMLFDVLLRAGRPLKVSEAARLVGEPAFDMRLGRVVLSLSPDRFTTKDRRWMLVTRSGDPTRPVERTIEDILELGGRPQPADALAVEVSAVYGRQPEVFGDAVKRLLQKPDRFARVGERGYARRCWLLEVTSDNPEDVLFDNFLEQTDIKPYEEAAAVIRRGDLDTVVAFLDAVGGPVPGKVLQFLVWQRYGNAFVPETLMDGLLSKGAILLSGQQWVGPAKAQELKALFPVVAKQHVPEDLDARSAEAAQPLCVSESELAQLVDYIMRNERTSRASAMLEDIFEVAPGEPTYEQDLQTVVECLKKDERVRWAGGDRFLPEGAVPPYVLTVPDNLLFNETIYYDAEGNVVDTLLTDEGFTGTLRQDIASPLAQDVGDEDPVEGNPEEPPVTVRCVLKFHHKEIGTFPLCQLPPGYFPTEPEICQLEIELPNGQVAEAWVNNETRLLYGLLDWYNTVPIDTGAVFYLARQSWDRYVLSWGEETEPALFVSRNRVNDLLELRARAEEEQMPTFEIVRTILEHYRKGIPFITILTEVGIVRRTRRRMVASLLSAYHCFYMRNNVWVFDPRRLSQGFDKSRRKYLVER